MLRFGGLGRGPGSSDVVVSALRYLRTPDSERGW